MELPKQPQEYNHQSVEQLLLQRDYTVGYNDIDLRWSKYRRNIIESTLALAIFWLVFTGLIRMFLDIFYSTYFIISSIPFALEALLFAKGYYRHRIGILDLVRKFNSESLDMVLKIEMEKK